MTSVIWPSEFEEYDICEPNPGLNPEYIPLVNRLIAEPLNDEERNEIAERETTDHATWQMPSRPLPESYLSFLAWSNGGLFIKGEREFAMFGAEELREYLLTYELPAHCPQAVAFAADGLGGLFAFDMRAEALAGEYPILHFPADECDFVAATRIADSFPRLFT
jgi:hypothetical protein